MIRPLSFVACFMLMSGAVAAQTYGDYDVLINVDRLDNNYAHNTVIYFDDESWDPLQAPTYGWDDCCDANLVVGNAFQPFVFTNVAGPPYPTNNQRLSVNALPLLTEPIDVPMGFLPGELAQFTFSFTELYTLPAGVTVELEDLAQNVTQDLLLDSTYTTWGATSDNENRFIIHFNPSTVTAVSPSSITDPVVFRMHNGSMYVGGLDEVKATRIALFDVSGRLLYQENTVGRSSVTAGYNTVNKGLYIVVIDTETLGRISRKAWF